MSVALLLLDLDGTLMDTAPDMGASLNLLRAEHNLPPLAQDRIRPHVSHGTPALLKLGFGIEPQDARFAEMRARYLAIYRQNLMKETRLFHGMAEVLDTLDAQKLPWGVVTNKPASLTDPLLELAGLSERVACVVSGDTIARRKPHPDPLFHACGRCQVEARDCAYVGDAQRDVEAAHAAGMLAVVALYGYLGEEDRPDVWRPDHMIKHPSELLAWLASDPAPRVPAETGT
ncbi:MAG TPA: phosphoglycolate phosphatase [Gammaproteobacteria bacterium]|nr:phosphoglycolate phosphatase [Gammaproteobacteria bacterium]